MRAVLKIYHLLYYWHVLFVYDPHTDKFLPCEYFAVARGCFPGTLRKTNGMSENIRKEHNFTIEFIYLISLLLYAVLKTNGRDDAVKLQWLYLK